MILLVMLHEEENRLSFFVDPNWRNAANQADQREVGPLIRDFINYADFNPRALFKRLCGLNFGPLVTAAVDNVAADPSSVLARFPDFVELRQGTTGREC